MVADKTLESSGQTMVGRLLISFLNTQNKLKHYRYYHTLPGAASVHTGHTGSAVSMTWFCIKHILTKSFKREGLWFFCHIFEILNFELNLNLWVSATGGWGTHRSPGSLLVLQVVVVSSLPWREISDHDHIYGHYHGHCPDHNHNQDNEKTIHNFCNELQNDD